MHALEEVARSGRLLLDVGLELELLVHPGVQPRVELALGAGVGAGRAGREPLGERVDLGLELVVGRDAVDQAPLERLRRAGIFSPSIAISLARVNPTRSGTNSDEPPSGTRPMFTNASRK